jgi:hypothetical protein
MISKTLTPCSSTNLFQIDEYDQYLEEINLEVEKTELSKIFEKFI